MRPETILVIFGAGASYDSVPTRTLEAIGSAEGLDFRPPLAKELFDVRPHFGQAIDQLYPIIPLVSLLRSAMEEREIALEGELEKYAREAGKHGAIKLAALQFYLQQILWICGGKWAEQTNRVTNYAALVEKLDIWRRAVEGRRVIYVTFNYDILLENALEHVGFRNGSFDDYTCHDEFALIKPHGSCRWGRIVTSNVDPRDRRLDMILRRNELEISDTFRFLVSGHLQPFDEPTGLALYPSIAVPLATKTRFDCPTEHLDWLVARIPNVRKIVTIGWRGLEAAFLDMIKSQVRPATALLVVAGCDQASNEAKANIKQRLPVQYDESSAHTFSSLITSEQFDVFLNMQLA